MKTRIALFAVMMASIALSIYVFYSSKYGHDYARTITFNALVVMQWASAFTARSDYESVFSRLRVMNTKLYIGLAISITLQMIALFGPLSDVLYVTPVALSSLAITGVIAFFAPILLTEIHKHIGRSYFRKGSAR